MSTVSRIMRISLETTVLASPQQVSCDIAGEAVLLSMHDGEYYGLNEVGASIWKLIQEPRTVQQVRDTLLEEYAEISVEDCEREVLTFLNEMVSLDLVEVL